VAVNPADMGNVLIYQDSQHLGIIIF